MKKLLLSLLVMSALMLLVVPGIFANVTDPVIGGTLGVTITTEQFPPQVWECDNRIVYDDSVEPGRISPGGTELVERINNYAFEGEQIQWEVLAMDKNGIEKIGDVHVIVNGNMEANCVVDRAATEGTIDPSCNAKIDEETLTEFNPETMAYYTCTLTVETSESEGFYGESDITVQVTDVDGVNGTMAEMEQWFFNPVIQLNVEGKIAFSKVRPGTSSYSDLVTVENGADSDSGVILDMFISGTDFSDSSISGAMCPTTNQLSLSAFNYYATNGAYATHTDARADPEGYVPIQYGIGFNNPHPFYGNNEIIQSGVNYQGYQAGNVLAPGADISLIFRLNLPEPCNGDFDTGNIYFWGEAI